MDFNNVKRRTFPVKTGRKFTVEYNVLLVFSLGTSAKATSQQCAREVTKAFSVVSNRVGIRERSVFWASRGAGREKKDGSWLAMKRGRRALHGEGQWEHATRCPARWCSAVEYFCPFHTGARSIHALFFTESRSHRKINGHFGMDYVRGEGSPDPGSNAFIYFVCIVVGRDMAR